MGEKSRVSRKTQGSCYERSSRNGYEFPQGGKIVIRAAAYCRVSTEHEDQTNSFEAQQRYFREYISHREGWELAEIYSDSGKTGTSTEKRSGFNRMIEAAERGRFDVILTKEVSRFSRNILDTLLYTRKLRELGVGVIFLTDGINTLDADAELRLSIMASVAQEESRKTSVRVKWGQTRQMERGVVFGHSLLGYDVADGKISVNEEGAVMVRKIFDKYVNEQKSAAEIARELDEEGIHTSSGGRFKSAQQILKILKNEKYTGDLVQKKTCTPDYLTHKKTKNNGEEEKVIIRSHHEPIIPRDLWQTAQEEMKRRQRKRENDGCSVLYPLSGKIRCGECGSIFIPRKRKRADGSDYLKWGCSRAAMYGRSDRGCGIGRMICDEDAMAMLKQVMASLELDRDAWFERLSLDNEKASAMRRLKNASEKLERRLQKLTEAYIDGNIPEEDYFLMSEKYTAESKEIAEKLESEKENSTAVSGEIARSILNGEIMCSSFCQNIVDRITLRKEGIVSVSLNGLDTAWNFGIHTHR